MTRVRSLILFCLAGMTITGCQGYGRVHSNPYSPWPYVDYRLSDTCDVMISIYNVEGELVDTLAFNGQPPGRYEHPLDTVRLTDRIYFCKLEACDSVTTRKVVLAK